MSASPKEQPIPITNLDVEEAKMHQKFKGVGGIRSPHEEHPITGNLKELGPYIISGVKEGFGGVESGSRDRVSDNENITSIYVAKEDKRSLPSEEGKQKRGA